MAAFDRTLAKAVHEVGHAILAVEAGMKLSSVTLQIPSAVEGLDGMKGAAVELPLVDWTATPSNTAEAQVSLRKEAYVLLAGPIAEATLKGNSAVKHPRAATEVDLVNLLVGSFDDASQLVERVNLLFPSRSDRASFVRVASMRVLHWLEDNRNTTLKLAKQFATSGSISENEIVEQMTDDNCIGVTQ